VVLGARELLSVRATYPLISLNSLFSQFGAAQSAIATKARTRWNAVPSTVIV
jgi:hypothetical protein